MFCFQRRWLVLHRLISMWFFVEKKNMLAFSCWRSEKSSCDKRDACLSWLVENCINLFSLVFTTDCTYVVVDGNVRVGNLPPPQKKKTCLPSVAGRGEKTRKPTITYFSISECFPAGEELIRRGDRNIQEEATCLPVS